MHKYLIHITMNLRLTGRDRTTLFIAYMFPLLLFVIFGQLAFMTELQVVTMVLVVGAMGGGLFSIGIRSVSDRERDILRRFKVAPVSPSLILISGMVTGLVTYLPIAALTMVLANLVYDVPWPRSPLSLLAVVTTGYLAFASIGSIVAAVVNSMQESQALVQLLYFPMLFLGGVTWPVSLMPPWLQTTAQFIPSTYMTRVLRPVLAGDGTIGDHWPAFGALTATTVVATCLAILLFRWDKDERMPRSAKLWLLVALAPFFLMGIWEVWSNGLSSSVPPSIR